MGILDRIRKRFEKPEDVESETDEEHKVDPLEYIGALNALRSHKDHLFKHDPSSPLTPEQQEGFDTLSYYPPTLSFRFELPLERADEPEGITFPTSTGDEQRYARIGQVRFEVEGEEAVLQVYEPAYGDTLFIPFRDATSGKETYGAGRYLEPHPIGGDRLLVDFNLAYNPYCAYNPAFSCPLPPIPNWLKVPIRAGEKLPEGEWAHQYEEAPDQDAE